MILLTDPCEEISRHVIPHHLVHDFVSFSGISIFQLKKNHVSLGICHNSEFWSWLKQVTILHHLTLEWFETQIWAPRCCSYCHIPPPCPPGPLSKLRGKEVDNIVTSWACLLLHQSAQFYLLLKKGLWYLQCFLVPAIVNWLGRQQEHRTSLSLSTVAAEKKHLGV